jgi:ribosome-associated protein
METTKTSLLEPKKLKDLILHHLEDKQAEKIVTINLENKSSIADYLIIATARSGRQAGAIADSLYRILKDLEIKSHVEGVPQCDWVLIDAGDVIVHIFRPEVRSFYNLEKMWGMEIPA